MGFNSDTDDPLKYYAARSEIYVARRLKKIFWVALVVIILFAGWTSYPFFTSKAEICREHGRLSDQCLGVPHVEEIK